MSKKNSNKPVSVFQLAGAFAEDKDAARRIRLEHILPNLSNSKKIVLDFAGVSVATQSFVHAMISEALRVHGSHALELIAFKSCSPTVRSVILTVVEYSLEARKA